MIITSVKLWSRQLRIHQWAKNFLLALPAIASFEIQKGSVIWLLISGFFAFSTGASAVYLLNDILDIEHDKKHHTKSKRPLAAGLVKKKTVFVAAILLVAVSITSASYLGYPFLVSLLIYFGLTTTYSYSAKSKVGLDVMFLTSVYVLRVVAGAVLIAVPLSYWLLAFSGFFFLSLGWVKRYAEIYSFGNENNLEIAGRGYSSSDGPIAMSLGVSSAFCSVLIFVLYVDSEQSRMVYVNPEFLWCAIPLLTYWLSRVWIEASRGNMHQDPITYALRDIPSLICGIGIVSAVVVAHLTM